MNQDQSEVLRRKTAVSFGSVDRVRCTAYARFRRRAIAHKLSRSPAKRGKVRGSGTYGAGTAHLITHSMHHRAQLLYTLRRLKLDNLPEGDVFSWEKRAT
jgi:uncharacterized damage-inducible protein DinB